MRSGQRLREGDLIQARYDAHQAIRLYPESPLTWAHRGRIWLKTEDWERALHDYTEAVRLTEEDPRPDGLGQLVDQREMAREKSTVDREGQVEELTASIGTAEGKEKAFYFFHRAKAWEKRALLSSKEGEKRRYYSLVIADLDEAARLYRNALPEPMVAALFVLVEWLHEAEDRATGTRVFADALRSASEEFAALLYEYRGWYRYTKGAYDEAIRDSGRSIQLKPDMPQVYADRGRAYFMLGKMDEALRDYGDALRLDPDRGDLYVLRSGVYAETGDCDKEAQDLERAVELNSQDAEAYNALAWLLAVGPEHLRDGQRAMQLAEQAAALAGDDPDIRDTLAAALAATGDPSGALREYEAAMEADPSFISYYQDILGDLGYADVEETGVYDAATQGALQACVRSGCEIAEPLNCK